ncbi:TAF5-like RNA polymerase II p300/CBP-associated factor-associated factor 65 kDa subunit 5L [Drosophila kikkawai]|uniref:TAF5-like RNA polymerase II p300/CBP-associated factor-associated factor 65 kDa subunit 5L n=1 Tax=Drosophila kikkawai TaxID=30033 RepID=A0A6P4I440_DROKI|nr:TAF5-like RNA polymerase II p300/CBP-associated factor-associated factor 65 kDa subunit 5L [Drosophila kikkawai]
MSLPSASSSSHAHAHAASPVYSNSNSNNNNKSSAGNKKTSSKNDLLRCAVGLLLKQKNYVGNERFRRSDFLLLQNKQQFAVNKMLDTDLHGGNSFTYSNVQVITNNQHTVDQQFGRFSQFVEAQAEPLRLEMKRFYGPMLCHFYLDLLKAREPRGAVELLRKYAHLVAPVDLYDAPPPTKINGCSTSASESTFHIRFAREAQDTGDTELDYFMRLVQILSGCTRLEAAESDDTVAHFRSSKYELHTSAQVVEKICAYLQRRGHVLIMNLLYTWLQIHIVENEQRAFSEDHLLGLSDDLDGEEAEEEVAAKPTVSFPPRGDYKPGKSLVEKSTKKRPAEEPNIKLETDIKREIEAEESAEACKPQLNVDACLDSLKSATEQILKAQVELPRILRISERSRGLTSAHLDSSECHLLAGFDNSAVQLWQLNQHSCRGKSFYRRYPQSQCPWELNSCVDQKGIEQDAEDEDSSEEDVRCSEEDRRERNRARHSKYTDNSYNEFGGLQLRGHTRGVTDVRFSAHYPLMYSVSKDATMRCWRAHNLHCAAIYRSHNYPIWCLDESPVGQYVVTGSKDLTARLWSLEKEHALIIYAGHTQDVECVAFHPNGNYIATGSADHSVRLWCATSGKLMRVFADCRQAVTQLAFSPDGKMLAAAGEETKVRIFDLAAGAQLAELKDHATSISSLSWSPHNQHLATACTDGSLRLWDIKKLSPMGDSSGAGSSSSASTSYSSATTNRVLTLNSSCQRLVDVFYAPSKTLYCIGT